MPIQITLTETQERLVRAQVKTGRLANAEAVVAEALGLLAIREAKLVDLDAALQQGLDDAAVGHAHNLEDVCDRLEAKYAAMVRAAAA